MDYISCRCLYLFDFIDLEYTKTQLNELGFTLLGGVLLSQGKPRLPSALKSLTSVFGMGTGVTSSLSPPNKLRVFSQN